MLRRALSGYVEYSKWYPRIILWILRGDYDFVMMFGGLLLGLIVVQIFLGLGWEIWIPVMFFATYNVTMVADWIYHKKSRTRFWWGFMIVSWGFHGAAVFLLGVLIYYYLAIAL